MKTAQRAACLTTAAILSGSVADAAVSLKSLFKRHDKAAVAAAAPVDDEAAADAGVEKNGERDLQSSSNCWGDTRPAAAWHPQYSRGWTEGFCAFNVDCNSPSFSSELACCKGAYAGQMSGKCLMQLPNPPTTSPTGAGGLDVYYPDYSTAWSEAGCINDRPMPSGRPTYSTMLACCKGAYGGQMSGKCLANLPTPPTTSPTTAGGMVDFWYPDYDTAWSEAGCLNTFPLPYKNENDRPNYSTQLACCKGAYGGQLSGKCLSDLPSPPTTSPTGAGGLDFFYPDYDTAWSEATCLNDRPLPYNNKNDRPSYSTMLACCKGAYAGQMSGKCLANLPTPPTTSPTVAGGLQVYYPDYGTAWPEATCINDRPLPSGRPTYSSKEACCSGAYSGQSTYKCWCDAVPVAEATCECACGYSLAERTAGSCTVWCDGDPDP